MRYELDRLGSGNFEKLIQSLVMGLAGVSSTIYGDGPDGQREVCIENAHFHINNSESAHGRTIAQAKYKSPDGKEKDWDWLRKNLKEELDGFRRKTKTHPHVVPETYLFFTNIILTPVLDKGTRDKTEKLISEYKDIIPNIIVLGADDIRALLENNREVARSYSSFIMPGDVLSELHDQLALLRNEQFDILIEYARQMFREDCAVRLEQAGSISDKSINIRNVYTDLEAVSLDGAERISKAAAYIIKLGNQQHRRDANLNISETIIFRPDFSPPRYNIVFLGNAGQGKSTLCQYICQIYRAALMRRFAPDEVDAQGSFELNDGVSTFNLCCERFPVLLSLKKYASWINHQLSDHSCSVIAYILSLVEGKTGAKISLKDFRRLLSGYSWVFLFDGLDEVPESSNRGEVLKQIQVFLEKDLVSSNCDSLVICTSRPQGYDKAFDSRRFNHFTLSDMSKELCRKYMSRLLSYLEDNSDYRNHYQTILFNALEDPVVSKLMTTPLYTAIIVLLVKMGGTPPKKRYDLFYEYCETIIKREQQKQMLPQINDGYDWIKSLHAQIGFSLQLESERSENAAAELTANRCKEIIADYLNNEEVENNQSEKTEELYAAITKRLTFLAEVFSSNHEECIVFPLRSIQEYYAAEWLISYNDENELTKALEMISVSAYWRNVYLFVAGFFTKHQERRNINETLFRICQRNCGDENYIDSSSIHAAEFRISFQGAKLALDLLCDNMFSRPNDIKRYLRLASKLLVWKGNSKSIVDDFVRLPEKATQILLEEIIIPYLEDQVSPDGCAFSFLWYSATSGNIIAQNYLETIISKTPIPAYSTVHNLLSMGIDRLTDSAIAKLFKWITEDYFSPYSLQYWKEDNYVILLERFYNNHPDICPSLSVLRQITYRMIFGTNIRTREQLANVIDAFRGNELLEKMISDDAASQTTSYDVIGNLRLRFSSIRRKMEGDYLYKYKELFRKYQLNELYALAVFLHCPSVTTVEDLIREYYLLPEYCKDAFFRIIRSCNWLLKGLGSRLYKKESIEEIMQKYDSATLEEYVKKDSEIIGLLEKDDVKTITTADYWSVIECPFSMEIPKEIVLDCLRAANNSGFTKGFVAFLTSATKEWDSFSDEFAKICVPRFDSIIDSENGTRLAIKMLEMTQVLELVKYEIKYPQASPHSWFLASSGGEHFSRVLDRINSLIQLGREHLQAYAIVPYLIVDFDNDSIQEIHIEKTVEQYIAIKSTSNQMALFGFILRALCDSIPKDLKNAIRTDLEYMLLQEDFYPYFDILAGSLSTEGKLFVHELIEGHPNTFQAQLIEIYTQAILQGVEAAPIDQAKLARLSLNAHRL